MNILRTARVAAPALAALTLTLALAGPASADPAFVMRNGSQINFAALPGESNNVTFSISGGFFQVSDAANALTPGFGCVQFGNPNTVRCGLAAGVTRIQASLGDRDDVATNNTAIPSDLVGGEGDDILVGGSGADRLTDSDGWNASPGSTLTFDGRGGNDTVLSRNGGYDRINCGENTGDFDMLLADSATLDAVVPGTCEFVQRF
ncbi:hypothetical protein OHA37_16560 [Streptomyces sp. NBC_00335]|uniref:hypothetical protein n=1 Tax=unclassified Streptomyces TaxID=2593676 RepID=UPI00225AA21A|nr:MULTISPECIES: hypothetical protein [unclassified Streptomyces]MCX5405494.1 hypothetical protein [Streptomyces sp. NBC_00086]